MKRTIKIGLFDSGIGGLSILSEVHKLLPDAEYFYVADDANAPYGPKTNGFIQERSRIITTELIELGCDLIIVACNTATAASIEKLRSLFPEMTFVGVEPFLNVFNKMPELLGKKGVVLTTVSTGNSERFKNLKIKIDPESRIEHLSLPHLANIVEKYKSPSLINESSQLRQEIEKELQDLTDKNFQFAILGCTHYPLVKNEIEEILKLQAISPCPYVAQRVFDLLKDKRHDSMIEKNVSSTFEFKSTLKNAWGKMSWNELLKITQ